MPTPSPKMGLALPSQTDPFSTADVRANWEKIDAAPGVHICLSTTRPAWGAGQAGRKIYETNTGLEYVWNGTAFDRPVGSAEPPTGSVTAYAGSDVPAGWLLCDGTTKIRSAQPALFAKIGTTFGPGDGSTTFHLPNLLDKFILGAVAGDTTKDLGSTGGSHSVTLSIANLPVHAHTMAHTHSTPAHAHTIDHGHANSTSSGESNSHDHSGTTDAAGTHYHDNQTHSISGGANVLINAVSRYASSTTGMLNVATTNSGNHAHNFATNYKNFDHSHVTSTPAFYGNSGTGGGGTTGASSAATTGNAGSGTAVTVTNPFMALAYIIKT